MTLTITPGCFEGPKQGGRPPFRIGQNNRNWCISGLFPEIFYLVFSVRWGSNQSPSRPPPNWIGVGAGSQCDNQTTDTADPSSPIHLLLRS
jgi:hypothetical protein